jgi:AraC-like DNA-binding protein
MKLNRIPSSVRLFGYFALLAGVLVIALSILNHVIIVSFYQDHLGQSYLERLKTADRIFTLWNDEMKNQSLIISLNEYFNAVAPENGNSIPDLIRLTQYLNNIARVSNKYHSIFIIPQTREEIVTSLSWVVSPERELVRLYRDHVEQSPSAGWWNATHSLYSNGDPGIPPEPILTWFNPLLPYATGIPGYIAFNIRESDLSRIINGGESTSPIIIVNEKGEVLSDADKSNIGSGSGRFPSLWNGGTSGFSVININGNDFFNVFLRSSFNSWYYYLNISMEEINTRMRFIQAVSIGLGIVFLVLTGLLSLFFARRLNKPVKSIVSRLRNNGNIRVDEKTNEFIQISDALETFSNRLSEDAELISEYQLLRMVSGNTAVPKNIFTGLVFRCIVILPEDGNASASGWGTVKQEIIGLCRSQLGPLASCFGLAPDKNSILILLNFRELEDELLAKTLRNIQDDCRHDSGTGFSAGIGKATFINEVYLSYNSAWTAISFRLLSGPGSILFHTDDMDIVRGYFYPHDREKMIFNSLRLGSPEKTAAALRAFCEDIKAKKGMSIDNVRAAFNQLMGGVIRYLMELRINSQEIFGEEYQLYKNLAEFEFIDDINNFFMKNFMKIIAFESGNDDKKKNHIAHILDYLKANEDKTFDLNAMAESLGLSYSHVRRIFTKEMGENILHYIYKQKVEGAKKLLLETDLSVNEIGEKKGFYNRLSFYRFFKKYEGITPGEFRESQKKQLPPTGSLGTKAPPG